MKRIKRQDGPETHMQQIWYLLRDIMRDVCWRHWYGDYLANKSATLMLLSEQSILDDFPVRPQNGI
jgi:hypothetical protein